MSNFLRAIFSVGPFVPHGHCYLWQTGLVGLHVISDALIALAYYSIPIVLFYFVRRRQDLPFKWIFLLFGLFIISCGTTHLLEIWTLWYPTYWLSGGMKAITALISVFTAIELVPVIPEVLAFPKPAELQRLNEELQISQARVAGILDIASDAIISIDLNQRITLFNQAAEKVFGYTAEEALGQSLDLLLPQRFITAHRQHVSQFKTQNGSTRRMGDRSEIFGRRKDGSEFPAEASISRLEIAGEKILTAFLRDISDRKQAEAELQAQQQFLRQVIDSNPSLIFVKDWEGRFTLANQSLAEVYNTTTEDLIGKTDADFCFNSIDAEQYAQADRQVMQTLQPLFNLEESLTLAEGTVRYFQSTKKPLLSADGQARYVLGVANDITHLKQTEAALQQKTEELEAFFSSNIDLLCIANTKGHFLRLNPEWERTLGYSLAELEGRSFLDLVHPDDVELTLTTAQLAEQQLVLSFVNRYRHQNGSYRWLEWRSVPRGDRIYATARDITDRKQAETQLQASLKEKEILLKEVHHRVKNNLQIIYSLLRLQRRTLKDPQAVQSLLDSQGRIESIALVHEKLYRAGNLARVDFAEYIPGLAANLLSSYNTQSKRVALETAIDPITLDIDKAVPCGLIINELISNSLKYAFSSQDRGRIQVAMYTGEGAKITLLVKDDGVGLPPGFDLAQTNSLGLQLVQDFVDQLKGTIQINCSQGTEFSITFSANPS